MSARDQSPLLYFSAYAALYIVWGSTYLAIRFTVETIPPFFSGALRFLLAGGALMVWCLFKEKERPTLKGSFEALKVAALMLLGGYGGVVWAEQTVPSSLAALIISVEPLWIVILDWLFFHSRKPSPAETLGIALGFGGTVFLVLSQSGYSVSLEDGQTIGMIVLMVSTFSWSLGALCSRKAPIAKSGALASGMQMTAGGILLLILSAAAGEPSRLALEAFSLKSVLSLAYLIVFGSLIGYTAFIWLLKVDRASRVVTHTFVNPIVAIILGWSLGDETLSSPMLIASVFIIISVVIIIRQGLDEVETPVGDQA
ncbi:MAG: EamA family transporter [Synergistaceae bacterium]|nr:EamA family transporter [Synergistota bacterium]NLM71081.1 EamA family transporter [Synergistaceae bacterium]